MTRETGERLPTLQSLTLLFPLELCEGDVQVPVAQLWQSSSFNRGHQATCQGPPPGVGPALSASCLRCLQPVNSTGLVAQRLLVKWLATGTAQFSSLTTECGMPSLGRETLYIVVDAVARE